MKIFFFIKQIIKMSVQNIVLPTIYNIYKRKPIQKHTVLFADAHHDSLPFSMSVIHHKIKSLDYKVIDHFVDYSKASPMAIAKSMFQFMKLYASAEFVFICDYFLPIASCRKRPETTVTQLWHSGGLMKKFAYDTSDDIPSIYRGNVFKNYDLVTVSAKCCEPVLANAMQVPEHMVKALGCNRTDIYYNEKFNQKCTDNFYDKYPDAMGKKIVMWAPTFRGNAANPYLIGVDAIKSLQSTLGEDWFVLIKVHPHIDRKSRLSNCTIPSERLLPVIDLLITDYSSILFDYILFEKPFVLFAPDINEYEDKRGLYIRYSSLPGTVVTEPDKLASSVIKAINEPNKKELHQCRIKYMEACDGHAAEKILNTLGIQ